MTKKTSTEETRTLLVHDNKGMFKVTIPASWKVTFSGFIPKTDRYGGGSEPTLRIYENEKQQRACFVGVRSFRDLSIPLDRLVVTEQGSSEWTRDEDGITEKRQVKRTKKAVREDF